MTVPRLCPHCNLLTPCWCDGRPRASPPHQVDEVDAVVERPPRRGPAMSCDVVPQPVPAWLDAGAGLGECEVRSCGRATPPGIVVCGQHAERLAFALAGVSTVLGALEDAHVRRQRFSASSLPPVAVPGAQDESPVPFNALASRVRRELVHALREWADLIAAERGLFRPLDTLEALPTWLLHQVSWIRSWHQGPEAVDRMTRAVEHAARTVDRPPDLRFAGPCTATVPDDEGLARECGEELYAAPGALEAECRVCGTRWPMRDLRSWLLGQVEDMLLPATELARAVDGLGVPVTPAMIRRWAHRGLLETRPGQRGPVYRVGDVLAKVAGDERRRAAGRGAG